MPLDAPLARTIAATLIFVATYLAVAVGRVPGLRLDRAGAALVGATLMVAAGALPLEEAYRAIDFDTITLLLGMMIVVANLRISGFFGVVNGWIVARARRPLALLAAVVLVTGVLSAFLVNDTVCLVMTPLVLELVLQLRRNPVPYALAIATASNIGSTATITGNPQNIIIGSLSQIPYSSFAAALAPVAGAGLVLAVLLIAILYRAEFLAGERLGAGVTPSRRRRYNRRLAIRSVAVAAAMIVAFFLGVRPAMVAIAGGAALLLTPRVRPARVYREIDWPLLVMFCGLFIVVAGVERHLLTADAVQIVARLHLDATATLSAVVAVLSNLVSNVPAVLLLRPFVEGLGDPTHAWKVVAMASTLAGNFTILGSVANLIVVQRARAAGVEIGFWTYFAVGAPLTVLTILVGVLWL